MFGLQFLFSAALWALPLAALPLILHLLFRQKSPVIPFSTLRFIQSSLRQNAARRKVHRWLLLACRALLIALLIWALAQPARRIVAASLGGGASTAAAIVVDTSYSMMLQDHGQTLLRKANDDVQDLLRTELRDADVAIFRGPGSIPRLEPAESYRGDRWAPLTPTPAPRPLIDRVTAAADLLNQSGADKKWLIVLTDAQAREFPRPIAESATIHSIVIDLHPADVRAAAITAIQTDPIQPRLGIPAQITIDLSGRPDDSREVALQLQPVGQAGSPSSLALPIAHFDSGGDARLATPVSFDASQWFLATARLTAPDALPWASERTQLVQIAPRQTAAVLAVGRPNPLTVRMVRLALDPSEGQRTAWPISVHGGEVGWNEALIVAILNQWPDGATAHRMADYVASGGSLVLFVQPGLEGDWSGMDAGMQAALAGLLPSPPQSPAANPQQAWHAVIVRPADPILAGIGDPHSAESRLVVTRLMRFAAGDSGALPIINAVADDPDASAPTCGLLWRRNVGRGVVYTWGTLPDRTCGNLHVWDLFPPTLVNAASTHADEQPDVNTTIGQPITLAASVVPAGDELDLLPPGQQAVRVNRTGERYVFADTSSPGLYVWQARGPTGQMTSVAWANVQLPAEEARLAYRPLNEIAPAAENVIAGHSLEEVRRRLEQLNEPRQEWTGPIAVVLLLLCVEALLACLPRAAGGLGGKSGPLAYAGGVDSR